MIRRTAALTAHETGCANLEVAEILQGKHGSRLMGLRVSNTFSATVWLQKKLIGADDSTFVDVEPFINGAAATPVEKIVNVVGSWVYRLYIKTGGYSSGTADVELYVSGEEGVS